MNAIDLLRHNARQYGRMVYYCFDPHSEQTRELARIAAHLYIASLRLENLYNTKTKTNELYVGQKRKTRK